MGFAQSFLCPTQLQCEGCVLVVLCCVVVGVVKIVIALIFQHSLPIPVIVLANNYNFEFKLAPQSLV